MFPPPSPRKPLVAEYGEVLYRYIECENTEDLDLQPVIKGGSVVGGTTGGDVIGDTG